MKFYRMMAAGLMAAAMMPAAIQAQTIGGDENWKDLGTGYLRDDLVTAFYMLSSNWEFPVQVQESETVPGRYRLVNAYINCPVVGPAFPEDVNNYLIIDASDPVHCYIELGGTSYYIGEGDEGPTQMVVGSVADDYYNNRYGDWTYADSEGVCGKFSNGCISFPPRSLTVQTYEGTEYTVNANDYDMGCTLANRSGKFRLRLPGIPSPDVTFDMTGLSEDGKSVSYLLTFSSELQYVKVATFEGEYTPDMAERIIQGTVEATVMEASGVYNAPYESDGMHTVVAVSYFNDGAFEPSYLTREWSFNNSEWVEVGTAVWSERIIGSNYLYEYNGIDMGKYDCNVKVEQNVESPWIIRLVEPYHPDCYPVSTALNYDMSQRHYLEFNFAEFDNVALALCENIGLDLGTGNFAAWSYADRLVNDDSFTPELAEALYGDKLPTGHYNAASRTATFDRNALCVSIAADPGKRWYEANRDGGAKIVFSEGVTITEKPVEGVGTIESAADNRVRMYSINGVEVNPESAAPGIYIVLEGGKSRKVVVK